MHRIRSGLRTKLLQTERGLFVCLLDTLMSPAKTAESIELPFGVGTLRGQGTMQIY